MKLTPVIITLMTIFSAVGAQADINLSCQGTVDKSVSLTANIDSEGQGSIKISYAKGQKMVSDQQDLSLISKPSMGSDNYSFATAGGDQTQYTINIRKHLVAEKTSGITTDVNLFIGQPYSGSSYDYGIICKIAQ